MQNNINLNTLISINEVKANKVYIVETFKLTKKQFSLIIDYFEKKSNLQKENSSFSSRYSVRSVDTNAMLVVKDLDKSDEDENNGIMVSRKFGNALEYARLNGQIEI